MPQTEDESRRQLGRPTGVAFYGRLDEPKQPNGIILDLAVDLPGRRAHR